GGAVYMGGMDAQTAFSECVFHNAEDAKFTIIPALPKALDNFAATYYDGTIWVAGGQCFGIPNKEVYSLQYPSDAKEWTLAATLPDECRLQPCVAVQNTASGHCLFVFGGYQPKVDSLGLAPLVHTDGVYISIADLKKGNAAPSQWKRTSPASVWIDAEDGSRELCRQAIVGSTSTASGYSHVLFFGGVDFDIFLSAIQGRQDSLYLRHTPEWYKFRKDVLTYHTITDAWGLLPGDSLLARAGACLTPEVGGTGWSYSGGELMPGVRSADVTHVEVTNEKNFGWINWSVLVLYLLAMLGMGMYFMRKENGSEDFFKGGGRIPWWAAGISIYATMLSAITYMTIPAKAYTTDWTYY
ncbi:MAG: cyclically-permuted mutarotase family protein, partial [Bacteroidaceae bacterium]|nr:cyclically-permuted mutarotase family protein [Bacteroidaceae bacterium]